MSPSTVSSVQFGMSTTQGRTPGPPPATSSWISSDELKPKDANSQAPTGQVVVPARNVVATDASTGAMSRAISMPPALGPSRYSSIRPVPAPPNVNVAAALSENPHSELPTEVWSEERIAEEERQIAYDKVQIALKHDIELKQIAVKKVELACDKFEHQAKLECLAMEMPRRQAIANSPSAIEADNKKRQVAAE